MITGPTDRLSTQHFPSHQKILYCVLNWGLGHATRSIPIIEALIKKGNAITLASDGMPLEILRNTFPELPYETLPAYGVRYPHPSIVQNMLLQAWPIYQAIRKENKKVKELYDHHAYDYIFSDNRPGCYHPACKSVYISHQLEPFHKNSAIKAVFKWVNQWHLRHFHHFYIPDDAALLLSGDLSRNQFETSKVTWIGLCSRMWSYPRKVEKRVSLLLSGPEPQRSLLEKRLLAISKELKDYHVTLVRGTSAEALPPGIPSDWELVSIADAEKVNQLLVTSSLVVCRSGYSTLADLMVTGCPALLIPTPGQTEQEYLAQLHESRWPWVDQESLTLSKLQQALKDAEMKK